MEDQRQFMTATQLASHLRVTRDTVLAWARSGRIPHVRLGRKVVRFDLAAVLRAIDSAPSPQSGGAS